MYADFFELRRRPFSSSPDPACFFPTPSHEEALVLLKFCIKEGDGVGAILGPPGVGKTLLCLLLIESLGPEQSSALIANTHMSSVHSMLQAFAYDLCLPFEELSEQELRLRLTDYFLERYTRGARTLLVVDEAQNLSIDQFEELRLFTNLEGRHGRAVQLVLAGQPRLAETLKSAPLESFRQRITVAARLEALDVEQSVEFVRAQIAHAGGSADTIFTADALSEICDHSHGIPRRINQIAYRSLLLAHAEESGTVDASHVQAAVAQLSVLDAGHVVRHVSHSPPDSGGSRHTNRATPQAELQSDGLSVVEVGADYPARSPGSTGRLDGQESAAPKLVLDPDSADSNAEELRPPDSVRGHSRMRQLYAR